MSRRKALFTRRQEAPGGFGRVCWGTRNRDKQAAADSCRGVCDFKAFLVGSLWIWPTPTGQQSAESRKMRKQRGSSISRKPSGATSLPSEWAEQIEDFHWNPLCDRVRQRTVTVAAAMCPAEARTSPSCKREGESK